jgi:TonB family protein
LSSKKEVDRRAAELLARPFLLPVVDGHVHYDADTELYLLDLRQGDGHVQVLTPEKTLVAQDGNLVGWMCRAAVPTAQLPEMKDSLHLLLRFQLAASSPTTGSVLMMKPAWVVGVRDGAPSTDSAVFDVPLSGCVASGPSTANWPAVPVWVPPPANGVDQPASSIKNPSLLHEQKPNYTRAAEAAYIEGVVYLDVTMLPDGSVDQKTIVITKSLDGQFGLDEQAVAAAKQWRFVPAVNLKTGEHVPMRVTLEMTFTLKSASWFRTAADQGDASAQYTLGLLYSEGQGVPQDFGQAVAWYRKAADQGNADAMFNLGSMYAKGAGVRQDYVEAHKWCDLAAALTTPDKQKEFADVRDAMANSMTPQQLSEAQKRARDWMAEFQKRVKK